MGAMCCRLASASPWRKDEVDAVGSVCIPTQERHCH